MEGDNGDMLVKLSDTGENIGLGEKDIRGFSVKDKDGVVIGKVQDLLFNPHENKVRFLVVESGGFLGMGETTSFIPIDAISAIGKEQVHIDQTRETVTAAPQYDPKLVNDRHYHEGIYRHFGYTPYWGAGYVYPGLPFVM